MEDWTCLGQHKRQPEFPVVTRESRRNSRKTTWLPRHRKMKPFPATAHQEKSHVRNWRSKGHLAMLAPMSARLASSCSRNGIIAVATDTVCREETSM